MANDNMTAELRKMGLEVLFYVRFDEKGEVVLTLEDDHQERGHNRGE
jgi:hypothetical protein